MDINRFISKKKKQKMLDSIVMDFHKEWKSSLGNDMDYTMGEKTIDYRKIVEKHNVSEEQKGSLVDFLKKYDPIYSDYKQASDYIVDELPLLGVQIFGFYGSIGAGIGGGLIGNAYYGTLGLVFGAVGGGIVGIPLGVLGFWGFLCAGRYMSNRNDIKESKIRKKELYDEVLKKI